MTILALTADTALQLGLSLAVPGQDVTVATSLDGLGDLRVDGFAVAVIDLGGTPAGLRAAMELHSAGLTSRIVVVGDLAADDAPPGTTVLLRPLELSMLREELRAALAVPSATPGIAPAVHATDDPSPDDREGSWSGSSRPSPPDTSHPVPETPQPVSDSRAALDELLASTALRVAELRQRDVETFEREPLDAADPITAVASDRLEPPAVDDPPVAGRGSAVETTLPGLSEALDQEAATDGSPVVAIVPARNGGPRTPARLGRWRWRRSVAVTAPSLGVEGGTASATPLIAARELEAAISHVQQLLDLLARVPGARDPSRVATAVIDEIREAHDPEIAVVWEMRDEGFVVASGHGLTRNQLRSTVPLTQPLLASLVASPGCHLLGPAGQDVTAFVGLPTVPPGEVLVATVPAEAPVDAIVLVAGAGVGEELRRWLPGLLDEAAPHLRLARRLRALAQHLASADPETRG